MIFNIFRILADLSHATSKCILIWAIHRNKSSEGVSLLTQILYAVIFITRYLDLSRHSAWVTLDGRLQWYNVFLKIFYILSSLYIVVLMVKVYPRTREREKSWKLALWSVIGSLALTPIVYVITHYGAWPRHWFTELCWIFSIILESVCVLPQLLLLRQTTVPTVIDSYYLLALGSYRALYILNWLVRGFGSEHFWDPIAAVFGVVQTALYIDFAWVYWSRQRVKLRNGGIVDSDDLKKSWIVNKIFNSRITRSREEEAPLDEEGGAGRRATTNRWGARGISISADDTLEENSRSKNASSRDEGFEEILEDEDNDRSVIDREDDGSSKTLLKPSDGRS
ncbi:hypothetical protein VTN00DRAFT_559 [Thermoascus crustaceus]|uniref:uncharacterized protein n=1 Tax=Thermoascus crustaceus TaxID=5088 RepID=UPI00374218C6